MYYLRHGNGGKHRAKFEEYLKLECAGKGGPKAFETLFGDLKAFDEAWQNELKDLLAD